MVSGLVVRNIWSGHIISMFRQVISLSLSLNWQTFRANIRKCERLNIHKMGRKRNNTSTSKRLQWWKRNQFNKWDFETWIFISEWNRLFIDNLFGDEECEKIREKSLRNWNISETIVWGLFRAWGPLVWDYNLSK